MPGLNHMLLKSHTAYSSSKHCFTCRCSNSKHARMLALSTVSRGDACFDCHVCTGKGSPYEKDMYALLDTNAAVMTYAVEAVAMGRKRKLQVAGSEQGLWLNKKRWDAVLLQPHSLLIEVQGEGHIDKEDRRRNNRRDTLAVRQAKDQALADAAQAAGFSVLWLHPGAANDVQGRTTRWAAKLQEAVNHVTAEKGPKLFSA